MDATRLLQTNYQPQRSLFGAGALIAVGYMDPGNWATDLAAGAQYGNALLFVVLIASMAAMFLQWIASRVGLITKRDIAELCHDQYSPLTNFLLWIAAEIAIIACAVAELVGSAVALQLLFHVSLWVGVILSAVGACLILALRRFSQLGLEWVVTMLIIFVGASMIVQIAFAHPDWQAILMGLQPTGKFLREFGMLWLAIGILGATIMPHNLYLHSTLVKNYGHDTNYFPSDLSTQAQPKTQTQIPTQTHTQTYADTTHDIENKQSAVNNSTHNNLTHNGLSNSWHDSKHDLTHSYNENHIKRCLRVINLDTVLSLSFAFFINAALLVMAAAVFHRYGYTNVNDLAAAHHLLEPLLGTSWSAPLFAAALLACGINSTITGTLAGQAIMEGFLKLRLAIWQRVLLTRAVALVPALLAVGLFGENNSNRLLVASQIILSMQLPLVVLPLLQFACSAKLMGQWRMKGLIAAGAWLIAAIIIILNILLIYQAFL